MLPAAATRFLPASFDRLKQDVLFAIRQFGAAPSFAIGAIATLAIGTGATVAVFTVVEAVVLRPLSLPDPGRVVDLHPTRNAVSVTASSNLEFATWRAQPSGFDGVAAIGPTVSFTLTRGNVPDVLLGERATSAFTRVFGVAPSLGRGFSSADDQPGAPHVVILGHELWQRDFNGDRDIVGQQVRLDGDSYTIIGVMPASFAEVRSGVALWVPLTLSSTDLQDFKGRYLQVVARLAPGVSIAQASAIVDGSEQELAARNPMWGKGYTGQATSYTDDLIGDLRPRLFVLLGAVACVFLIAGVNVANLLLARGATRRREMAIRAALGAKRGRLVRQLLTESAVLCVCGGAVGVALAAALVRSLVAAAPRGVPRIESTSIDGAVLLFALLASALCSLLVGLAPARHAAHPALQAALREGARGTGDSKARERARAALVATEFALALALLTGAGLLIRTAWEIGHLDPGFDSRHILTAQVLLPPARYPDLASGVQAYRAVRDQVTRAPGVQGAALTSSLPLGAAPRAGVGAEGQPLTDGERLIVGLRMVSLNYFATMKIRLRLGRDFTTTDNGDAPNVAIVNEALAKRLWPGQSPLGKRMEGMDPSHRHFMEVVGVIADTRDVGLDQVPTPEFYIPFEQMPPALWAGTQGSLTIVARTTPEPTTMERAVRGAIDVVDPSLPLANVAAMDDLVRTSRATERFNTLLFSTLGAIALLLASVGVYGVVAYSVAQRTREIGLRIALGATPAAIARLILRRGLAPIAVGAIAGGALSVAATRLLREQLYGVSPGDPTTIAAIAALLFVVSLVALYVPTRRAMRIAPTTALAG
jgi:putative ABC transport system permease protein